jgi:hypothetical protein
MTDELNISEKWDVPTKLHVEKVNLEGAFFYVSSKRTSASVPFIVTSVTVVTAWDSDKPEEAETDVSMEYVRELAELATPYRGTITLSELTDSEMVLGFDFVMPAWLQSIIERGTPRL